MTNKIKITAISGSTRKSSSNLNLINAIALIFSETLTVNIIEGLSEIPHFNPDLIDHTPPQVDYFKEQLRQADAILICTPEYAIGVPGTLKNAIDWTVSSMEFSNKPVALITASTYGQIAHKSLLGTLLIIEAKITADTQLVISSVKTKVSTNNQITDSETLMAVNRLIQSLTMMVKDPSSQHYLPAPVLTNS